MRIVSSGVIPETYSVHTIAAYDLTDGRVLHTHYVVLFEGANMPDLNQIKEDMIRTLERRGTAKAKVEILHAGTTVRDFNAQYRVDLEKKSLVKLQRPHG